MNLAFRCRRTRSVLCGVRVACAWSSVVSFQIPPWVVSSLLLIAGSAVCAGGHRIVIAYSTMQLLSCPFGRGVAGGRECARECALAWRVSVPGGGGAHVGTGFSQSYSTVADIKLASGRCVAPTIVGSAEGEALWKCHVEVSRESFLLIFSVAQPRVGALHVRLPATLLGCRQKNMRLPATPLLGCAAILVDFLGLGMIAPILPGIVSDTAVGNILTAQ